MVPHKLVNSDKLEINKRCLVHSKVFLKIECFTDMLWYLDKICSSISSNLITHCLCSADNPDNLKKTQKTGNIIGLF